MKYLPSLFLIALAISACAPAATPDLSGEWQLVSYGEPSHPTAALPGVETSFRFEDGQFSGNAGCNGFGGTYEISVGAITFSNIMSTMMYCEETSAQEQGVLAILGAAPRLQLHLAGETLTLQAADGGAEITLKRK